MARTTIAILFGGASEEHPVSVKSAREVLRHLDRDRYEPVLVGITSGGEWRLCPDDGPGVPRDDWAEVAESPALLSPDPAVGGLLVLDGDGSTRRIRVDAILPVLHGRHGEDGAIQGLLELSGIPYAGCDIASSALAMDKGLAYTVAGAAGILTPEFRTVRTGESLDPASLEYPVFVKPARSGSSFGVSRVDGPDELGAAVALAREFDTTVLVERAVAGSEIGCAVIESDTELALGEPDEVRLTHGFFRIHQEDEPEVRSENSSIVVPAGIPASAREAVRSTALAVYRALGCQGLARVDLFVGDDGRVVLNEVNTFPGMTSYSRFPRMMAAAGVPLPEVIDRMVAFALRGRRR
jgi:D-alanine--(R)-lactate ligase